MFHSSAHWLHWSSTLVAFVIFFLFLLLPVFAYLSYVLLVSRIKKLFFLVSVRQSVCLSVFVHVAVFMAVWLQVETWGHPHQANSCRVKPPPLAPRGPNRRGLVLLSFPSCSFSLCVRFCVINVFFCLPSCKDLTCEVGEVSLSPCSLYFISYLPQNCFSCSCLLTVTARLLVSESCLSVCNSACQQPT